jgi:hypothetical protein
MWNAGKVAAPPSRYGVCIVRGLSANPKKTAVHDRHKRMGTIHYPSGGFAAFFGWNRIRRLGELCNQHREVSLTTSRPPAYCRKRSLHQGFFDTGFLMPDQMAGLPLYLQNHPFFLHLERDAASPEDQSV